MIKSWKLIGSILLILLSISCSQRNKIDKYYSLSKIELSETKLILSTLAHDSLGGRKPGSIGFRKASDFVTDYLSHNSITPFYDSYLDSITYDGVNTHNVLGLIGSKDRKHPHILIGAHLDHLGLTKAINDSVYNGANDNASGVTAVLQISKKLAEHQYADFNIIIALFSGEEEGLRGSKDLAKRFKQQKVNLKYVINFDMVGTVLTDKPEQVYATGFLKSDMAQVINSNCEDTLVSRFSEEYRYGIFYRSDNYPFYKELGIPAHTFSTFDFKNFDYYHKPQDETNGVDFTNLNMIINKMVHGIDRMLIGKSIVSLTE